MIVEVFFITKTNSMKISSERVAVLSQSEIKISTY